MLNNITVECLRFLAMPQADKISFLPLDSENVYYLISDGSEIVLSAEAIILAIVFLIDIPDDPGELTEIIKDISYLMTIMIKLDEVDNYMWFLDKDRFPTAGAFDRGWLILQRLARLALQQEGFDLVPPQLTFADFISSAGIEVVFGKRFS